MSPHPYPERAPNTAPRPPLPVMASLPDGRFAVRAGVRFANGEVYSSGAWRTFTYGRPALDGGRPVEGWQLDPTAISDEEVAAATVAPNGGYLLPMADVTALAAELEGAGQFAAAAIVRQRIDQVRIAAGLVGR